MSDDKSFDDLHSKLNDIVKSSFNLSEWISKAKIVRKIMRSLPDKFISKVTAIEEKRDLDFN